jgi:hypothetical protein
MRDQYSRWIWISYYGDESFRLGQFMAAAIYDAVLRDVVLNLPDAGRETAEGMIVSIMQGMIAGAAKATYSAAREAAIKLQPTLTEKMKPLIQPYVVFLLMLTACISSCISARDRRYVTQDEKIKAQVAISVIKDKEARDGMLTFSQELASKNLTVDVSEERVLGK